MDLRYPTGKFQRPASVSAEERSATIAAIEALPENLSAAVAGLSEAQLDTPYRPDGWTVRQVVHHIADSHINAYIRVRFALTTDTPTVQPYDEGKWANLFDARTLPVSVSIALLRPLHTRWTTLLRSLTADQFARPLQHPESGTQTVDTLLALYAWHGRHHTAHITELRKREGWT